MNSHLKTSIQESDQLKTMANAIRVLTMDAVEHANSGHPGMPMGMADVATVLFTRHMKFNPFQPLWPNRDRFVLSAGHGSMLLYALAYLTGYAEMTIEQIRNFRKLGSLAAGHPELHPGAGIEMTTGPLGQGLATSVGMAVAERMLAARYGNNLVDHYTYVMAGDGCLMEGISHEAISLAGHLRLNKLIVLFDDNHISIDGPTSLAVSDNQVERFRASGWHVQAIDGHDYSQIDDALTLARQQDKPCLIACRTTIAYGSPGKGGTAAAHGSPLGHEEIQKVRQAFGWPWPPFEIPEEILRQWRMVGSKGHKLFQKWEEAFNRSALEKREAFLDAQEGNLPAAFDEKIKDYIEFLKQEQPNVATRQSSGHCLEKLTALIPALIGGSADLTGSNNTKASISKIVTPDNNYQGQYIHYGVREHAMAAVMNGLSLNGFIPYGGTFLVFSDYCRPAIRLSALMKQRVIYVMTHDSIGLGEDGPTHQPIEHLASLRAIPNLQVFRPCDAVEVAECWALALKSIHTPSILALSRQNLPTVRIEKEFSLLSGYGAYILKASGLPEEKVRLFTSGSEVSLALEVKAMLEKESIGTTVVSMPCWSLFEQQPLEYQESVLGNETLLKVGIEAGSALGWHRYTGPGGLFFGLDQFGASASYQELYKHFGLTPERITDTISTELQKRGATR